MPWFWQEQAKSRPSALENSHTTPMTEHTEDDNPQSNASPPSLARSFTQPTTILATAILTSLLFSLRYIYTSRLRRIPNPSFVPPSYLLSRPSRSIFGPITKVTDPDNFRIYHTPGGLALGWHWLRNVPETQKELSGQTLHIRIAGIDAPEMAHFGNPAQPYSDTAMAWLKEVLEGRRVRVYTLRRDQYERVVATAFLRRTPSEITWRILKAMAPWSRDTTLGPILKRDVGLEMLKAGLATVYEARVGAEFGAQGMEEVYKEAERKARSEGVGMWRGQGGVLQIVPSWRTMFSWLPGVKQMENGGKPAHLETPREYKTRIAHLEHATVAKTKRPVTKK